MKHEWKAPVRFGIVLFALYLAIHYWGKLSALLLLGLGAAFPLVLGAVVAYAVNILMSMYERWYFPASRSRAVIKSRRPVCLVLAYASLIAIVVLIVRMILPELANSVSLLVREMVPLLEELSLKINENLDMNQLAAFSGLTLADGSRVVKIPRPVFVGHVVGHVVLRRIAGSALLGKILLGLGFCLRLSLSFL